MRNLEGATVRIRNLIYSCVSFEPVCVYHLSLPKTSRQNYSKPIFQLPFLFSSSQGPCGSFSKGLQAYNEYLESSGIYLINDIQISTVQQILCK